MVPLRGVASPIIIKVLLSTTVVSAGLDLQYGVDDDLTSFVTHPEIKAPRFNITVQAERDVTPGYWFVAPYAEIVQRPHPRNYYQPCSTGPHIYDNRGDLIWSGACQFRNQNACDFRAFTTEEGYDWLSTLFNGYEPEFQSLATILNASYHLIANFSTPVVEPRINMHEWNVIDGGHSAIYITHRPMLIDSTQLEGSNRKTGWITEIGFREIAIDSGDTKFEWWSDQKISPAETTIPTDDVALAGPPPSAWNWFHPNSVDKNLFGDYLLSGRFTDAVYKISRSGDIIWRLGGKNSSFHLDGFNFSKQHDARFVSSHGNIETISLFDNAKALYQDLDIAATSSKSSVIIVDLDTSSMTAKVVRRHYQPDGLLTPLRGNFQLLANGNAFVCWADNGYITEHDPDDNLLLSARFTSKRFVTYRGYKFNFTGYPSHPPALVVQVFGETPESSTTVWHASWNGATEVAEWRFYKHVGPDCASCESLIGSVRRDGFETTFSSDGFVRQGFAEAWARNGSFLGRSTIQDVRLPPEWGPIGGFRGSSIRETPSLVVSNLLVKDEL